VVQPYFQEFSMKSVLIRRVVVMALSVALAGCATHSENPQASDVLNTDSSATALSALNHAPVCCSNYNAIQYRSLQNGKVVIDAASPVMAFTAGHSYFYAGKIADQNQGQTLTLTSLVGKTVMPVSVILLDSNFVQTRSIDASAFPFTEQAMMSANGLSGELKLLPNEKYLIIYAPMDQMHQSIAIPHPEKLKAKATGMAPPPYPDIQVPYSPWGVVDIKFDGSTSFLSTLTSSQDTASAHSAVVPTVISAPMPPPAAVHEVAVSTQTQQYYQQAIQKAVRNNQIEQAMQLVAEAEKLGFTDAKQVFVEAVKQK